jgi:hypothetical protein
MHTLPRVAMCLEENFGPNGHRYAVCELPTLLCETRRSCTRCYREAATRPKHKGSVADLKYANLKLVAALNLPNGTLFQAFRA